MVIIINVFKKINISIIIVINYNLEYNFFKVKNEFLLKCLSDKKQSITTEIKISNITTGSTQTIANVISVVLFTLSNSF